MLGSLSQWIAENLATFGYPGLAAVLLVENLFPPIPSEVVLPLAGFSLLGAYVLYALGLRGGRPLVLRNGQVAAREGGRPRPGRGLVPEVRPVGGLLRQDGAGGAQRRLRAGGHVENASRILHPADRTRLGRVERALDRRGVETSP